MNRLFIIGNGFDLAHGLPTSYNNFIDDFWTNLKLNYKKEFIKNFVTINELHNGFLSLNKINSFEDLISNIEMHASDRGNYYDARNYKYYYDKTRSNILFNIKNDFFKTINIKKSIQNWVDIENEYYKELKKIAKSSERRLENDKKLVEKLNIEFNEVKTLLEKYLTEKVQKKFDLNKTPSNRKWIEIYNVFKPINHMETNLNEEFTDPSDKTSLNRLLRTQKRGSIETFSLLLNFNYTTSIGPYFGFLRQEGFNASTCYIHGRLNSEENLMNFGFGDEMDEDYKSIENIDDNEYLKYFKSFQYLQNKNYNSLLNYINGEKFQVCILGHSCGLSDRTLLNTIFEHKNCRSIKVFYHQNGDWDNYTDIVQNISRHFNDKKIMREKIVPKSLCKPLPQEASFDLKTKEA
ncbi:AbiH family protein [Psychroserpens luteolus]|uniref:AbiH family protein n=1 Tax=Psychroserpens luteolus TaxID=2855840 RepID=UPI001E2C2E54|nr:AbiH family protein [Psychroserpens luteolus]MCD2258436.1 bacteriophage abortive infection AbiH family protein [Psychroserpens luteolus]